MKQIVLIQISTGDEDRFFEQTKTDDNSLLVIFFWVAVLFFLAGVAVGWVLHRKKVKKGRIKRRKSSSKSRQE